MSGPRLSIIPAGAIFDRSLEPRDMHVLNLLGCYTDKAGWCRRSQVKMAQQLDCSRSSVQRSLDRLCDAGWVQKKRPPWSKEEGQPSNSYMYRVVLDRDDAVQPIEDDAESDADESYAENAIQEVECPPVGTGGAQHDGHPGAHPCVGTGAQPYVGTKNDPLERPLLERERDARARDRTARFLVDFEKRWPTAAADDRQRTAYAAEALTEDEQQGAIAGIGPFLENLARLKRKHPPAGWRYLEEKRWTLLAEKAPSTAPSAGYPPGSPAAKAIEVLHEIAGRSEAFRKIWRRADGTVTFRKMTPQLLALAQAPLPDQFIDADRRGAASWERMLGDFFGAGVMRQHIREGARVPWPFAPSAEGKIYSTGPPAAELTEEDLESLR